MKRLTYLILLSAAASAGMSYSACAAEVELGSKNPFSPQPAILPVDRAFAVNWVLNADTFELRFTMPSGYYLYRHAFELHGDAGSALEFEIAAGVPITDEYFGDVEVYYGEAVVAVPLDDSETLKIRYQGCAEAGYCYPPQTASFNIEELR